MRISDRIEIFLKRLWLRITGKKRAYLRAGRCLQCGRCCRNIAILLDGKRIKSEEDFELLKAQEPEYEIFEPHSKAEDGTLIFSCRMQKGNKCSMHSKRPEICRDYPDLYIMYSGVELLKDCGYVLVAPYDFEEILKKEMSKNE